MTASPIRALKKKQPPSTSELAFARIASKIREGKFQCQEDITNEAASRHIKGAQLAILQALYDAMKNINNDDDFWKVYNAITSQHPKLQILRQQVALPAPLDPDGPLLLPPSGTLLSEVQPETIQWLWKYRLALGKITMLDGDPGLGKSLIGADLSARLTRGLSMPDNTPGVAPAGVVIIMPEDGLSDTIQPRFARAGANLTKVSSIGTIMDTDGDGNTFERPFNLERDLGILEQEIERVQAKLVYIDPITAILPSGKDTYKDNEVRSTLFPLKSLVEKMHVSCVLVRHLTKSRGDNPLMAGNGSMAFIALARTGLMVVRNPEDDHQIILSHIKSNIGKIAPGITYTVCCDEEEGDERPYIVWGETTTLSGADLMNAPRKNTGGNRQAILDLLEERAPDDLSPQEIAEALPEMSISNVKVTLKRMYDKKEIGKSERGAYHAL